MTTSDAHYVYDGSFDGFLCVVFESAQRKALPATVACTELAAQGGLFGDTVDVATTAERVARVRRGLITRVGEGGLKKLYHAFLSEAPSVERQLLELIYRIVDRGGDALDDLRFAPALAAERLAARVRHEVHRMHAFVRFERYVGDQYIAFARPEHNVLPLLEDHFAQRYPAMRWAIVDARRNYALAHTPALQREKGMTATQFVASDELSDVQASGEESAFQSMWLIYYEAVTITERQNRRLHLQHVPRRYWPYLTEKRVAAQQAARAIPR